MTKKQDEDEDLGEFDDPEEEDCSGQPGHPDYVHPLDRHAATHWSYR